MVLEDDIWRRSDQVPWQASGLHPEAARFAPGTAALVWLLRMGGEEVGTPRQWGIAVGGGIAIPWFSHGIRAAVVAEFPGGYGPWLVVDPQKTYSTKVFDVAEDNQGNVHLIYESLDLERLPHWQPPSHRYVKLEADLLRGIRDVDARISEGAKPLISVQAVEGQPIEAELVFGGRTSNGPAFVPLFKRYFGELSGPMYRLSSAATEPLQAVTVGRPRDTWWGKDFPILYLAFSGDAWSTPIEVGLANVSSFWGWIWDAYDIVSAGQGAAFVVWPTDHGIVGRWIERLH
jgi:hypothetical protein